MRDHDLPRNKDCRSCAERPVRTTTLGPEYNKIRECFAQTTSHSASTSSQSALGWRLAAEGHCGPGPIRAGPLPSADENDHLPRQDRKNPWRARNDQELEYNSKSG